MTTTAENGHNSPRRAKSGCWGCIAFRRTVHKAPSAGLTQPSVFSFTYQELEKATNGFANRIGIGGFGSVYKGELPEGKVVAVKRLTVGSVQGEQEFRAEVEMIRQVHHRNLVSLVGYCIADKERLLVYEYVPNGTLQQHLHAPGEVMDWPTRFKVAVGAARGLAYLHEGCHPRIIHRDMKSSNILLDQDWEPQVSDFGLAKHLPDKNTHVTTRVAGTFGSSHLAPEYASTGMLTAKSDVYSFGVVLLELLTGRKPVDTTQSVHESLVEWAREKLTQALEDGNMRLVVDERLIDCNDNPNTNGMRRTIEVAAACVRPSASERPTMGQVGFMWFMLDSGGPGDSSIYVNKPRLSTDSRAPAPSVPFTTPPDKPHPLPPLPPDLSNSPSPKSQNNADGGSRSSSNRGREGTIAAIIAGVNSEMRVDNSRFEGNYVGERSMARISPSGLVQKESKFKR